MITMECAEARTAMLEADVSELEGAGTTTLARHINGCSECRTVARRILRSYADLETGLATFAVAPKSKSRLPWISIPLAAAALAVLLVQQKEPLPEIALVTARMFQEQPVVMPPEDKQAIIIEKNDLTVVWLY